MGSTRELAWWTLAAIVGVAIMMYLFVGQPVWAGGTVTYTDAGGNITGTAPLGEDGRFNYRVQVPRHPTWAIETNSVLVEDDTGQMQPLCLDISSTVTDPVTVVVTSEVVVADRPLVTVTGTAFNDAGCAGARSVPSNPITVEFVPEPPGLLAPLPQ